MSAMYTVRALSNDDAEAWAKLRHEAVERHPFAFGAPLPDDHAKLVESFTRIVISRTDDAVMGAFTGTSLIGIVGIRRHPAEKQRHKAELWGMYVTPTHRGAGVGEMLLRAAMEQAGLWAGLTRFI